MKALALLLYLIFGLVGITRADDPVVMIDKSDGAMNAAIARARSEVDKFITVLQAHGANSYSVKVPVTDGKQTEHFWTSNVTYANGVFSATIDNDPELVKNVKLGDKVTAKKQEISDWLYMKDGKMYGAYTLRAMLPKLSKEEADHFRAILAD